MLFFLSHPASVPVPQGLWRGVSSPQPRALRQDQLQLRSRTAGDQGADQGQRVLVEVGLKEKS